MNEVQNASRPERGQETRQKLLLAAIEVFGRQGFEASTRALANAAGVNLAAIPYHFGGKEGLYLAAAEHIADQITRRVGPTVAGARSRLRQSERAGAPLDRQAARALLLDILEAFARMLIREESASWARFIIREQMEPSAAFERLYEGFIRRTFETITSLIAQITDLEPRSQAVRLKALSLIGRVLIFRAARATVLRQLEWDTVGDEEFAAIRGLIRESVETLTVRDDYGRAP